LIKNLFLLSLTFILASCEQTDDFFDSALNTEDRCELLIDSIGIDEAYHICLKDAQAGNPMAQVALAQVLQAGELGEDRRQEGVYWLELAVAQQYPLAELKLGKYYIREKNIDTGIQHLKNAARNNNVEAQVIIGKLFYAGEYFNQDIRKAKKWFTKATRQQDPEAQFYLSEIYRYYVDIEDAQEKANHLLKLSAESQYIPALVKVAELLIERKQYINAAGWLAKASKLNSAKAQYILATLSLDNKIQVKLDAIALLEKSRLSYLPAQVRLAYCFKNGERVAKDLPKAKRLLENAAELGHEQAFFELGMSMIRGDFGYEKDVPHGIDYLKISAKKGFSPAKYILSTLFVDGQPILGNKQEAIKNLALQAIQDLPRAQYKLAKVLAEFKIPAYDRVAYYWLEKAAKQDDNEIHFLLATFYAEGIGTQTDFTKATSIYKYLANKQYTPAYMALANMYYKGLGVDRNDFIAKNWIIRAIDSNVPGAKKLAKALFRDGVDFSVGMEDSAQLVEFAAESNLPAALYTKGKLYLDGKKGYEKSVEEGMHYLNLAAKQGYAEAQRHLGMIYENNLYGASDSLAAYHWYQQAAKTGDEFSQFRLAYMYFNLPGDDKNKISAYAWANLAASTGMMPAEDLRDLIFDDLTPDELEAGQALSLQFLKHYQPDNELFFMPDEPLGSGENVHYN
tara:strand:- start:1546 stop:3588 length:2043 start_codon:yes stop_codon:yes gene_type:complete